MSANEQGMIRSGLTRHRLLSVGVTVAVTLAAVFFTYAHFRDSDRERLRLQFEGQSRNVFNGLHENFDLYLETVQSLASLHSAYPQFDREQFRSFVSRNLRKYRGIQALEWIPRVDRGGRADFELAMRDAGHVDFAFRKWTPDGEPKWTTSTEHWTDEYFPVYFMELFVGNEAAFGIDLGSHPVRRAALDEARNSGKPIATAPTVSRPTLSGRPRSASTSSG